MSANATGTPSSTQSIPKLNTAVDAPNGTGINEIVDSLDTLINARMTKPVGPSLRQALIWDGAAWSASSVKPSELQQEAATNGQALAWSTAGGKYQPTTMPGSELAYTEFTAPVTSVNTTEATADVIVTASPVLFDGSTICMIEFFTPYVATQNLGNSNIRFVLYDGAASIGYFNLLLEPYAGSLDSSVYVRRRLTPAAATKTYSIRAFGTAGTIIGAGTGGVGNYFPGYIRITRV